MTTKQRALASWLAAAIMAAGGIMSAARPVAACSCAPFDIASLPATAEPIVVVGALTLPQADGIRFDVDRWYAGSEPSPVIVLDQHWFHGPIGDCGRDPLPLGIRYIVAMHRQADGRAGISLCAPLRRADTTEGSAWIEQARTRYGDGITYPPAAPAETVRALARMLGRFGIQLRIFPPDYQGPLR